MTLATLFLIVALILFAVPTIRAAINGAIDFTNGGLMFATAAFMVPLVHG